ncbi:MAG: ASPIC/UnbV domain-containing protein, partial [Cyclobacteriaceae bacterium]
MAVGAKVVAYTGKEFQLLECSPVKGWLSSVTQSLIFGLGKVEQIDSLKVQWMDGKISLLKGLDANQSVTIEYSQTLLARSSSVSYEPSFIPADNGTLEFIHKENEFVDFDYEVLIPKMISKEGPKIAIGDVNNDGLEDLYIGGAKNQEGKIFLQSSDGKSFLPIDNKTFYKDRAYEDIGVIFIDVDSDQLLDLYVVSGGGEPYNDLLKDRLYINLGDGKFGKSFNHPELSFNGSCVVKGDFNQDGVEDLF